MPASRSLLRRVTVATLVTAVLTSTAGGAYAASGDASAASGRTGRSVASSAAAVPAAPVPAAPTGLPAGIEDPSPYIEQTSCDPTDKPGTVALGLLLQATYPQTSYAAAYPCGTDGVVSEHYEGRALDWFTSVRDPQGGARADAFLAWLLAPDAAGHAFANARRLGVMYLIWNNRIWGSYAADAGWRPYSTCAAHPEASFDTVCHRDHVHISLSWAGAWGRTSFWTRRVASVDYGPCRPADLNWARPYSGRTAQPCPDHLTVGAPAGASTTLVALVRYSGAVVGPGASGPAVSAVQRALGVSPDGVFGPTTGAVVSSFRSAHGLGASSTVDDATWRALLASSESASPPSAGGSTPAGGRTASPGWTPLQYGSTGTAVSAVQRALHVTPVSGWFGPLTRAAVSQFQRGRHLPVTGVVDATTARALGVSP